MAPFTTFRCAIAAAFFLSFAPTARPKKTCLERNFQFWCDKDTLCVWKDGACVNITSAPTLLPPTSAPSDAPTDAIVCPDRESFDICTSILAKNCHWKSNGGAEHCTKCGDGSCRVGKDSRICDDPGMYDACTLAPSRIPTARPTETPTTFSPTTSAPTATPTTLEPTGVPTTFAPTGILACPSRESFEICASIKASACHWKSNGGEEHCTKCLDGSCRPGKDPRICDTPNAFQNCTYSPTEAPTLTLAPTRNTSATNATSSPTQENSCPSVAVFEFCASLPVKKCRWISSGGRASCTRCNDTFCAPGKNTNICSNRSMYDHCAGSQTLSPLPVAFASPGTRRSAF